MSYTLRVVQLEGQATKPGPPITDHTYIASINVDAHDGQGEVVMTEHKEAARVFENAKEAMLYWRRQSTVRPLRADGKPNRPGTAFTIEVSEA
jgi:hypothetical protein